MFLQYLGICEIGYGYNGSDCSPCPKGSYKSSIGNDICDDCKTGYTTSSEESTDETQYMYEMCFIYSEHFTPHHILKSQSEPQLLFVSVNIKV